MSLVDMRINSDSSIIDRVRGVSAALLVIGEMYRQHRGDAASTREDVVSFAETNLNAECRDHVVALEVAGAAIVLHAAAVRLVTDLMRQHLGVSMCGSTRAVQQRRSTSSIGITGNVGFAQNAIRQSSTLLRRRSEASIRSSRLRRLASFHPRYEDSSIVYMLVYLHLYMHTYLKFRMFQNFRKRLVLAPQLVHKTLSLRQLIRSSSPLNVRTRTSCC